MATYWLSFRLHSNSTYERRQNALNDAIQTLSGDGSNWWFETTSFYVFSSPKSIDTVAASLKSAIDQTVDIVVIGMPDYKTGRVIGKCDDEDIFTLIPFMKKA